MLNKGHIVNRPAYKTPSHFTFFKGDIGISNTFGEQNDSLVSICTNTIPAVSND